MVGMAETVCVHISRELYLASLNGIKRATESQPLTDVFRWNNARLFHFPARVRICRPRALAELMASGRLAIVYRTRRKPAAQKNSWKNPSRTEKEKQMSLSVKICCGVTDVTLLHLSILRTCVCLCLCMCTAAAQMKNDWLECFCLRRPNRAQKLKCSLWLQLWLRTLPYARQFAPSSFFYHLLCCLLRAQLLLA